MNSIDELWDFNDPALSESKFREALEKESNPAIRAEICTQIARTFSLRKQFEDADMALSEAQAILVNHPNERAQVRLLLEKGRRLNSAGLGEKARQIFQESADLAGRANEHGLQIDAMHMVAITYGKDAEPWNRKALKVALTSDQPAAQKWAGSLYNNLGWDLFDQGKFDEALVCFERQVTEREKWNDAGRLKIARWCVARCLRQLARIEEAIAIQLELIREPGVYVSEELAYLFELKGNNTEAKKHAESALQMAGENVADEFPANRLEKLRSIALS